MYSDVLVVISGMVALMFLLAIIGVIATGQSRGAIIAVIGVSALFIVAAIFFECVLEIGWEQGIGVFSVVIGSALLCWIAACFGFKTKQSSGSLMGTLSLLVLMLFMAIVLAFGALPWVCVGFSSLLVGSFVLLMRINAKKILFNSRKANR
ncbi:MAG: hypothetical protein FWG10_02890 [Eubacteriaceae bacterium]|nr:hypothetical protein [Eubacteriaceae bacterium]